MTKNDELCGRGKGKPLYELRNLVAMLEREEAARKEREERSQGIEVSTLTKMFRDQARA